MKFNWDGFTEEEAFTDYIYHSNYSAEYNLVDKATEPLHTW